MRKLATADRVHQDQVSALEAVQQVASIGEDVIGSGPPPAGRRPG